MLFNMWNKILLVFLFITSCTVIETTVESSKRVGNAVVDETVDLGKVLISIPVDATKTIVDKLDEEINESTSKTQEQKPPPIIVQEEDKSIYTSLYGLALALFIAVFILACRFLFTNLLKGYR